MKEGGGYEWGAEDDAKAWRIVAAPEAEDATTEAADDTKAAAGVPVMTDTNVLLCRVHDNQFMASDVADGKWSVGSSCPPEKGWVLRPLSGQVSH